MPTWTWNTAGNEPGCLFRFKIDKEPSGIPAYDYNGIREAAKDDGDGKWYIHIQAKDQAGNESEVETAYAILDNTPSVITGLILKQTV